MQKMELIYWEKHEGDAITEYANTFDCNKDSADRKTVDDWALLGDPPLKIGGYS